MDGEVPSAALVQGADGNFYGTTYAGGTEYACAGGCGTVFKITPGGTLTTLHSFVYPTEGVQPVAALIQATDGNFYSTTENGGAPGFGTVFKITPTGTLTVLYSFCPQKRLHGRRLSHSGAGPGHRWELLRDHGRGRGQPGMQRWFWLRNGLPDDSKWHADHAAQLRQHGWRIPRSSTDPRHQGTLYGTTAEGASKIGKYQQCSGICGTVFSLSVGLGPFVEAQPGSGKVGAAINILGTDLTGATSVTFNGTAAKFIVVSSSEITTTVPSGATTGEVEVVTPSGTLSSNVSFQVP